MSNVIRFPVGRGQRLAETSAAALIPRAEFERLAELALDVVDQIVALLDAADSDPDLEPDVDLEPSLAAPVGGESQIGWARGGDRDFEDSCSPAQDA